MFKGFKEWWATKPWTRVVPWLPAFSFGKANDWYEEQKDNVIKQGTSIIKSLSLPMFLGIIILILLLIFWKSIQKMFMKVI